MDVCRVFMLYDARSSGVLGKCHSQALLSPDCAGHGTRFVASSQLPYGAGTVVIPDFRTGRPLWGGCGELRR